MQHYVSETLSVRPFPWQTSSPLIPLSLRDTAPPPSTTPPCKRTVHFHGAYHVSLRHLLSGIRRWAQLSLYASGSRASRISSRVASAGFHLQSQQSHIVNKKGPRSISAYAAVQQLRRKPCLRVQLAWRAELSWDLNGRKSVPLSLPGQGRPLERCLEWWPEKSGSCFGWRKDTSVSVPLPLSRVRFDQPQAG